MFGLPFWAVKAIGIAILVATVAGMGARLASIWYAPQVAGLKSTIAAGSAAAKAAKAAQATVTRIDEKDEQQAQLSIARQARTIIKKVPVYVSTSREPAHGCVTVGMLRLHDAAALGLDPADLPPPAGQSDEACSSTSPSDFMATIAGNYSAARANEEQLNALEADIQSRIEAIASDPK